LYNRVRVYGNTVSENIISVYSANDATSQNTLWVKDRIIQDTSLFSREDLINKANIELEKNSSSFLHGSISAINLLGLIPGQLINVSVPYANLIDSHRVEEVTHSIGSPVESSIAIQERKKNIKDYFLLRYDVDDFLNLSSNLNNMLASYHTDFSEDPSIFNLSGVVITDNKLELASAQTTGTATTIFINTDFNVTECEFRRFENDYTEDDVYEVTNNGGLSWETLEKGAGIVHEFSSIGNNLGFRITMNRDSTSDPSPAYEAVVLLYK
jgi:hypothetical protein